VERNILESGHDCFDAVEAAVRKDATAIWEYAAQRHLRYLQKRFVALSHAFGATDDTTWPRLKQSTLKSKRYKQKLFDFTGNVNWVLRLSHTMMRSFSYIVRKDGYFIGIIKDRPYPQVSKATHDRARMVYCKFTVAQLADIHQKGRGVPRRSVMPSATNSAQLRMLQLHVNDRFRKLIQKLNSMNKPLKLQ